MKASGKADDSLAASLLGIDPRAGGTRTTPKASRRPGPAPFMADVTAPVSQRNRTGAEGVVRDGDRLLGAWRRPDAGEGLAAFRPTRSRLMAFEMLGEGERRRARHVLIDAPKIDALPDLDPERIAWIEQICEDLIRTGRPVVQREAFETLIERQDLVATAVPARGVYGADVLVALENLKSRPAPKGI